MTVSYVVRRVVMLFVIVIAALTLNFFVPRCAPGDPVSAALAQMASTGVYTPGGAGMVEAYREIFGLDESLPVQYYKYLEGILLRGDLGRSITFFPAEVRSIVLKAMPWTLGLLSMSTLIAFALGSILGALLAWPNSPYFIRGLVPLLMPLSAIPYYLLALLLLFLLALTWNIFPLRGAYEPGTVLGWDFGTVRTIVFHSFLPSLSIVLSGIGFWALGMRGLMVSVIGEDYLTLAEAKGLPQRRIFLWYGLRNALLPQTTALALAMGYVASGAVLVEVIFSYPGIGFVLYQAVGNSDYFVIQGVILLLVIGVALGVFVIDLLYPRLDPRITYGSR